MENKYQEALFKIRKSRVIEKSVGGVFSNYEILSIEEVLEEESNLLKELVDKATPKKPIKLEIIDLDEIIMPEYTNTIDKYMCDNCGLTWFIVDGHTYQHKYCKQCGQALGWSKDE